MTRRALAASLLIGLAALAAAPRPAEAQFGPLDIRAAAEAGITTFSAGRSFDAVTGSPSGPTWGGGVEAVFGGRVGVGLRASRFAVRGERVFPFEGTIFRLGVPATITVTPIELTGTYRVPLGRLVPYGGGGVGWHRYAETSPVADPGEDVRETAVGYHVLGGAEVRLASWLGVAGEAQWTRVSGALTGGLAQAFDESDLGGRAVRVRVIVGR